MSLEIRWTAEALRGLRKLDTPVARRVLVAIGGLAEDPRPAGARAPAGDAAGLMRLRVGDHRVIYQIEDGILLVTVIRVAHRREVYRSL